MTITDCHVHIFPARHPLSAPRHPDYDATLEDVSRVAAPFGVERFVVTQPSFLGFDNAEVLATVARRPRAMRGVVWLAPDTDPATLPDLKARGVAGLRFPLFYTGTPDWPAYADIFAEARRLGIHVELGTDSPRLPGSLEALLRHELRIVVAHLGRFEAEAGPAQDPGFLALLDAAPTGGVWVKLTAHYRSPAHADAACATLLETFGPERLVWGSDWPHVGPRLDRERTYGTCMGWFRRAVPDTAARRRILSDTPAALYGFDETPP